MTSSIKPQKKQRYRLYFPLMDMCMVFAIIGFGAFLADTVAGIEFEPNETWWGTGLGVLVVFFNALLTPFLIVARFLRDEYAEQLWRRTAIVLVYFFAVTPLILLIVAWITYLTVNSEEPVGPIKILFEEVTWAKAMHYTWLIFGVLFVAIFELLRFLDSRS